MSSKSSKLPHKQKGKSILQRCYLLTHATTLAGKLSMWEQIKRQMEKEKLELAKPENVKVMQYIATCYASAFPNNKEKENASTEVNEEKV